MLTFIFCITTCILLGVLLCKTWGDWQDDRHEYIVGGLVAGAVLGIFSATFIGVFVPRLSVRSNPLTLVSVRSADGVRGTFVWGSGTASAVTTYNFMIRNSNGSFTPGAITANSLVHIVEDKTLTNVGYWTTTSRKVDLNSPLILWSVGSEEGDKVTEEELRVPVGTVSQGFKIQ